jgi:hypothetical protein
MFFSKNYFWVHNYLFNQRSINSFTRFYPVIGAVTLTDLAAFWNRHNKFKNNQNNTNPSRCVILCDLVARKNNKLWILPTFRKSVHKKELSRMKFHGFQARWASYGHNHGIVCSNYPILCICVHLGMANKVALGSINFLCIKNSFFIFLMLKMGFFVKHLPKISFKNGPPQS